MCEQDISIQFSSFEDGDLNILADQIELYAFLSEDLDELSREDIINLVFIEKGDFPSEGDMEVLDVETDSKIDNLFQVFDSRISRFGDCYPFTLDFDLLVKKIVTTKMHSAYVFSLACSNLTLLSDYNTTKHFLTSTFELLVVKAIAKMLPNFADVRRFGAGSEDRRDHYGSNLKDAIQKLAEDCCYSVDQDMLLEVDNGGKFKESSSGDCGLDVVGTASFPDGQRGSMVLFCQCATGKDWGKKFYEPKQITSYMKCFPDPLLAVSIPYDYRDIDGNWARYRNLDGGLLIDRSRLFFLLDEADMPELPTLSYS